MSNGDEIVDIAGEKHAETEKAVLWYDGTVEAWIPKSQIEAIEDGEISLPLWLAKDKGLI